VSIDAFLQAPVSGVAALPSAKYFPQHESTEKKTSSKPAFHKTPAP
jgi:hypothetical protein